MICVMMIDVTNFRINKLHHHQFFLDPPPPSSMTTSFPLLPIHNNADGDFLEYKIYPLYPSTNLQNVLDYTLDLMSTWTDNYIWNLDPFTLSMDPANEKLRGRMDMGEDSGVAFDEWVVVGVLWQISKRFQDIIIRYVQFVFVLTDYYSIQDADGEFLLIESALHIPDWLRPETAENRVFPSLLILYILLMTGMDPQRLIKNYPTSRIYRI